MTADKQPEELIRKALAQGLTLRTDGHRLYAYGELPTDLRDQLHDHKQQIINMLWASRRQTKDMPRDRP